MTQIGFIGLGLMGSPMSKNLIKAGYPLTVWNRSNSRIDEVVEAGAIRAASPREVAERSEVTIICVSDSPDVNEVILGDNGVIYGASSGSIVIDHSTISPAVTRSTAGVLKKSGIDMLDAPVSGGVLGAINGTLSIMVGGERAIFDRCKPITSAIGEQITYCGASGMGQMTKLANQIIFLGTLAAVCEGLVFISKAGGDSDAVMSAFLGGAANSWAVENMAPRILEGDFAPGYKVDLAQKDLRLVLEAAAEMNVPLLSASVVNQIYRSAQQAGLGSEGVQAYVKVLEQLVGVEARSSTHLP